MQARKFPFILLRPASSAGRSRGLRPVFAVVVGVALTACYSYMPLETAPAPGTEVSVELNDRGRLDLEQRVGPDVALIEGLLQERSDSELVVSVSTTAGLYGSRYRWAGEPVSLRPTQVRSLRERRLDVGRTTALVAALGSSVALFVATRGLLGGGFLGDDRDRTPPPDNDFRIPF